MRTIYKIEYHWYEGEHNEQLVVSDLEEAAFENLLSAGILEVSSYPDQKQTGDHWASAGPKEFGVRCLPSAYDLLLAYLEEHGCELVYEHHFVKYRVEDDDYNDRTFCVFRVKEQPEFSKLGKAPEVPNGS